MIFLFLSNILGFATELLASLLQHDRGAEAPALLAEVDDTASVLGGVPHQIRGFLSRFHQMMPTVRRFSRCTACGETVHEKNNFENIQKKIHFESSFQVQRLYRAEGFAFLDRIFRSPSELELVTGLTELQRQADEFQSELIEFDDNESI